MKPTAIIPALIAVIILACGTAGAATTPSAPHKDFRPNYAPSGCDYGAACHPVTKGSFLPTDLDRDSTRDYSNFCLACHNAAGEAHEKAAGSPSTSVYNNQTALVPGSYSGDSHGWNGSSGKAGTVNPSLPGFEGTNHLPGGKVRCQTCHEGMGKRGGVQNLDWIQATSSDQISYQVQGYAATSQYLAKYLKVYRNAAGTLTRPTNSKDKRVYLVSPSEYTFNWQNGVITFLASQAPTAAIYVDIPQPYFREDNTGNRMCLDCHGNRVDGQVSHAPGTGAKDSHPVMVKYGKGYGLHTTLKASATGNAYLEYTSTVGDRVLCTSCHDPHNADSKNGMILREADGSTLCADCHKTKLGGYSTFGSVNNHNGAKHSSATVCIDCHTTHGSRNIMLIRNVINGKTITFRNFTGANSYGNDTGSGVCEACHATTTYHQSDGDGGGHNTGKNCVTCHTHEKGFGGFIPGGCEGCHGTTGAETNDYTYNNSTQATVNMDEYTNAGHGRTTAYPFTGNSGANLACTACHTTGVAHGDASNPFRLTNADTVALCTGCHATIGNHDLSHVGQGTWGWTPKCVDCHDPHGDKAGLTTAEYNGAMVQGDLAYTGSDTYGVPTGGATEAVDFPANFARAKAGNFLNWSSFVSNVGANKGACRVCHTDAGTNYFTRSQYSSHNSSNGACTTCHTHGEGFKPSGGACDSCHPYPNSATNDWSAGNGHRARYDMTATHMVTTGYDPATDTYEAMTADATRCGKCHSGGTHKTGTIDLTPLSGSGACGGAYTIAGDRVPHSVVHCSDVKCHSGKTTPNWY